ncbi:E3 SUMO-protein ligase KIAA1586-like [Mobula birostris]|uniref:E3 SUMO-protein ligase KIAA1586-like n=1 Tax=Mobula birostris TaxID=1983395 RepID=UPI003B286296
MEHKITTWTERATWYKKALEAQEAVEKAKFGEITLKSNNKIVSINYLQFLTSLINNLQHCMFTATSLKGSQTPKPQSMYKSLLNEMCVLDKDIWPTELLPNYGEAAISSLCKRFKLSSSSVISAFRGYVENRRRRIPQDLRPLLSCSQVIPISTAERERGFSHMKLRISTTHSRILINHVSALMFVKLHGPPLVQWNPELYVTSWLRYHRSADDTRTRVASDPRTRITPDPLWKILRNFSMVASGSPRRRWRVRGNSTCCSGLGAWEMAQRSPRHSKEPTHACTHILYHAACSSPDMKTTALPDHRCYGVDEITEHCVTVILQIMNPPPRKMYQQL